MTSSFLLHSAAAAAAAAASSLSPISGLACQGSGGRCKRSGCLVGLPAFVQGPAACWAWAWAWASRKRDDEFLSLQSLSLSLSLSFLSSGGVG